ncbi:formyltransferase family protein [Pseudoalteromonas sp. MMG005]|uniref:formyltransferase family protein n=1 Tax=Pseudoalteromonas sp. MMG005 TaxID=2822682 RepID=UPI001B3A6A6A|nr:formyltransferase family protein [Pseudoalteromonas sp. MMG005]MBQ4844599.1 hypothetical protein [Pseudoalteromonas sp. MMG005]
MRVALSNIENVATQEAMVTVIRRHHRDIKLVILSDPYSKKNGGFFTQLTRNLNLRGLGFVNYLCVKMTAMPIMRWVSNLLGKQSLPSIRQICDTHQIPCIKVKDINAPDVVAQIKKYNIDLLAIFYFDQILQQPMIDAPRLGVVNFHPAYLPSCRGLFPILFSYLYNQQQYGLSAHWVTNTEIDAGPLIAQCGITCDQPRSLLQLDRMVCNQFTVFYPQVMALLSKDLGLLAPIPTVPESYYSYPNRAHLKELKMRNLPLVCSKDITDLILDKAQSR